MEEPPIDLDAVEQDDNTGIPVVRSLIIPQSGFVEMCEPSVTAMLLGPIGGVRLLVYQHFIVIDFEPGDNELVDETDCNTDYRRSA